MDNVVVSIFEDENAIQVVTETASRNNRTGSKSIKGA